MTAMPTFSNAAGNTKPVIPTPAQVARRRPVVGGGAPSLGGYLASAPRPQSASEGSDDRRIEYGTIRFAEVQFDPAIQRDEQPTLINDIARNWNADALGVVAISVREDPKGHLSFWSLDGQQRMKGTMKAAETEAGQLRGAHLNFEFAANFYYGLTVADEAQIFLELNNKISIGAYDKFRNAVLAGYEAPVQIEGVLKELGIAINQPNGFSAWSMALRVSKMEEGVQHLRWALKMVQDLWKRPGDPNSIYDGKVLEAFARMRHRYGSLLNRDMIIDKFNRKGATLSYLIGKGRDKARINNQRAVPALIDAITEIYNMSLSERSPKRLPDWNKPKKTKAIEADGDNDE